MYHNTVGTCNETTGSWDNTTALTCASAEKRLFPPGDYYSVPLPLLKA